MGCIKIIKVAWLCHFSNQEIHAILKPRKKIGEIAPWITALARLIEEQKNIELHIVSPYEYINSGSNFEIRGIHYHFFNAHIPLWGRHWPGFFKFDDWSDYFCTKIKIKKIINKIDPDIIHLHGAENAYYSSSILQFKNIYPVLITIQGFISNSTFTDYWQVKKRIYYELKILKTFKHFGYRTQKMGRDIMNYNPDALLHWHHYPFPLVKSYQVDKNFDIVYFARVSKDKGIEDLLKAIALIKLDKVDVKLCVIGKANATYMESLKKQTLDLQIRENVTWKGFLPSQAEVHFLASEARISVLPTYNDLISGTIIESMFLRLPVVAYNVGSIHEVNEKEEIISLVKKGDIEGLAKTTLDLLKNENMQAERAYKGYKRAKEMFDNINILRDLLKAYKEVIDDFKRK